MVLNHLPLSGKYLPLWRPPLYSIHSGDKVSWNQAKSSLTKKAKLQPMWRSYISTNHTFETSLFKNLTFDLGLVWWILVKIFFNIHETIFPAFLYTNIPTALGIVWAPLPTIMVAAFFPNSNFKKLYSSFDIRWISDQNRNSNLLTYKNSWAVGIHKLRRQDFSNFWLPPVCKFTICSNIGIWLTPSPVYVVYGCPLIS